MSEPKKQWEKKPLTGAMFKNEDMTTENDPYWKGSILMPDGKEYWINGWLNTSKAGKEYLKIGLKEIDVKPKVAAIKKEIAAEESFDDEIPF
jgi:hypothetical protein